MNNITPITIVGDAHVTNKQNLTRFTHLNSHLLAHKPEYCVLIGDFLSLDSLSSWDQDKRKTMEGQRFWKEIDAGNTALDMMTADVKDTKFIYLMGNHEDRLDRYFDRAPTFDGDPVHLTNALKLDARGMKVIPYRDHWRHRSVAFTHIPMGGHNQPISGVRVCHKALNLYTTSIIFGHTHRLEFDSLHRHGSPHLQQALCVGCFFEHTDGHQGVASAHWRGIIDIEIYDNMRFDINTISMRQLYNRYR